MPGINPLQERTQAGPALCSSPCSHLYSPAPEPKLRAAALGCQYTIPSEGSCCAWPRAGCSATLRGKLLKECYATGKAARSFCQMASGEWASQSRLSLDTLLIHAPFLRLRVCTPFPVPLPFRWEGTARHPYLPQFLPPACLSGILFSQFDITPFSLLPKKWRKVMERWEKWERGTLSDKQGSGSAVQMGMGSARVSATTFPHLVHVWALWPYS